MDFGLLTKAIQSYIILMGKQPIPWFCTPPCKSKHEQENRGMEDNQENSEVQDDLITDEWVSSLSRLLLLLQNSYHSIIPKPVPKDLKSVKDLEDAFNKVLLGDPIWMKV